MQTDMLIKGERVAGLGEPLPVLDPSTGETIIEIPEATPEQIKAAAQAAHEAFESYHLTPPAERAGYILAIADVVETHIGELPDLGTLDVGKPWPAMKGSGIGCDMSVYALDAYMSVRHVMVAQ